MTERVSVQDVKLDLLVIITIENYVLQSVMPLDRLVSTSDNHC